MYIRCVLTRDVKTPTRAHTTDAGIDFYIPNDFKEKTLHPGENVLIPSGVKIEIPVGFVGLFLNKSSVASKKSLLIGAQVIDPFYSGEVHIDLHNVSNSDVTIKPGEKIAQMLVIPVVHCQIINNNDKELYSDFRMSKYREDGGFGSTGL